MITVLMLLNGLSCSQCYSSRYFKITARGFLPSIWNFIYNLGLVCGIQTTCHLEGLVSIHEEAAEKSHATKLPKYLLCL